MTLIVSGFFSIITGIAGLFTGESKETLDLFSRQKKAGYSWHYTGSMPPPPKTKFFSLKSGAGEDVVLFQLKREQVEAEIADLED